MRIIGLTGGIASGKSTIAMALRDLGLPVFDADAVSRAAVQVGSNGLQRVAAALGNRYLTAAGDLDRAAVAELVFHDVDARRKLEEIIHNFVWNEAEKFLSQATDAGATMAVLDVPLLIECGWQKRCDSVWLVALPEELQLERACERNGLSREETLARIRAQLPLAEKARQADVIIDNSGSRAETLAGLKQLLALEKECAM